MTLEELLIEALTNDGDVMVLTFQRLGADDYKLTLGLPDNTTEAFVAEDPGELVDKMLSEAGTSYESSAPSTSGEKPDADA